MDYLMIAGGTALIYLIVIIMIRLLGKKELAQISVYDFVFLLLICTAVQNAMLEPKTSFFKGLCAAGTLFILNYVIKYIAYRFPNIAKLFKKNAIMLIYNGSINKGNLVRAKISITEIEKIAKDHGIEALDDIDLAVLEIDGNINISSKKNNVSFKEIRELNNAKF